MIFNMQSITMITITLEFYYYSLLQSSSYFTITITLPSFTITTTITFRRHFQNDL